MGKGAKGKRRSRSRMVIGGAIALLGGAWALAVGWIDVSSNRYIYDSALSIPSAPVGIVFGAGVLKNGQPSRILRDRLEGAIALYRQHKISTLLMSGDNRTTHYNEPKAMRAYAIKHLVKPADIEMDYAGRDTYDTCYRAKNVFGIDKAVLITQLYHAPRAVFLGRSLGIQSVAYGVRNLNEIPIAQLSFSSRELCADLKAIWDVSVSHRKPYVAMDVPKHSQLNIIRR